jgi:hypothetical protein
MFYQRFLKVVLAIGLSGLMVLVLIKTKLMPKIIVRAVLLFSKYSALMKYVAAHAQLETANFTSRVYMQDHNCFGMKWTNERRGQVATKGLLSPEGDYYAHYETDSASVLDLLKWFDATRFPVSVSSADEYANELKKRNYFGGPLATYIQILNKYLKV